MNRDLGFDRKKHSMYPKAMGKKIREKLISDFGETVGDQLWEKNCVKGSFCDFCIVADQNPLAGKYERIRDEYGFIISKKKERN